MYASHQILLSSTCVLEAYSQKRHLYLLEESPAPKSPPFSVSAFAGLENDHLHIMHPAVWPSSSISSPIHCLTVIPVPALAMPSNCDSLPLPNDYYPSASASSWADALIAAIAKTELAGQHQESTSTRTERNHSLDRDGCTAQIPCNSIRLPPKVGSLPPGSKKVEAAVRLSSSRVNAVSKKPRIIKPKTTAQNPRPSGRKNKKEEERIRDFSKDVEVALFTPYGVVHSKCWMYVQTDSRRKFYKGFFEKHANLCDGSGNCFRLEA